MDDKNHNPTDTLIEAMSKLDNVTHSLAVVAFEDGNIDICTGYMPVWMVRGLLREALDAYELKNEEVSDLDES